MALEIEVNRGILDMQYAVRGPIPARAVELADQGQRIVPCNIGNPLAYGRPLKLHRQILALVVDPHLISREKKLKGMLANGVGNGVEYFSDYSLEQAVSILKRLKTGVGPYSPSKGHRFIRKDVARFIDQRDNVDTSNGVYSNPDNIFLTNGASEAAKFVIKLLISNPKDGIMTPVPQYPLYSATITECGGSQVDYLPNEEEGWTLDKSMLEESLRNAKDRGVKTKAIVVINPGNPTGATLDRQSIEEVIQFAEDNGLAIIADEVYQENTYGAEFVSFAEVLGRRDVPLFSLHSTSKGFYGECGFRGGYLEVRNPPKVLNGDKSFTELLEKMASVSLCSNVTGQVLTRLMVTPPTPNGGEIYDAYARERDHKLSRLYNKANMIRQAFGEMDGVECFGRTGAMYLFPRLTLPEGTTDFDYCMALLEETGLCIVNGSGFGLKDHVRIAFLPPEGMLRKVLPRVVEFHNNYVNNGGSSSN